MDGSIAREMVAARVQNVWQKYGGRRPNGERHLMGLVMDIMLAASGEKRELDDDSTPEIKIHDAWQQLASDVMNWAKGCGLSFTIANRTENSRNWPSPFVKFFTRLQDTMPEDYREFVGDGPLTAALLAVREKSKKEDKG
ncbi:hypothetical protein [Methylocystis sp.]|uniref:hypothetical protein n=1 Tax=Methylocystis sp. TaxID=1911079 RepID=UPI003D0B9016